MSVETNAPESADMMQTQGPDAGIGVALLTGADDKTYALGLASALLEQGISVDFIGSDTVNCRELDNNPLISFLNLRGDQSEDASLAKKSLRIFVYYIRLLKYAVFAKPRIFHILWNNKFEIFDRTVLMLYYRLTGRKITLTAHNINAARRDSRDSIVNRLSLRIQYRLADHIFVHSEQMRGELCAEFGVRDEKVSTIPFGINDVFPTTNLTNDEAKHHLGLGRDEKAILFFGRIAPYKGLSYLVTALPQLAEHYADFRIIIAGKVKASNEKYWGDIEGSLNSEKMMNHIILVNRHIPDEEVEIYFKAADVLVLPYTSIYQSGLPFLAYNFGLPIIATDTGSLKECVVEGETGFVCRPRDHVDLARAIQTYFSSEMYRNLETTRPKIQEFANVNYSWRKVGAITNEVYRTLLDL